MHFRLADITAEDEATPEDIAEATRDMDLAVKIYTYIIGKTPSGYIFRVRCTTRGGVAIIEHPLLPPSYGYVVHLKDLANEYGWKIVDRAVGLLLEIFELPRHSYNKDLFREKSQKFRTTKLGLFKREVDMSTGRSRLILPDWVGAKA